MILAMFRGKSGEQSGTEQSVSLSVRMSHEAATVGETERAETMESERRRERNN